ncbi:MAG TPA: anti-sigma factor [Candidatus Polarisedimenticolia bacterium]|jgi:murein DD-endopeptidase MepM/ murein hydrolase activator NlpD
MRCEEIKDLIPLREVDLLDTVEEARVREHLDTGCPRCAAELAAARELTHMLPFALPPVEPSPMAKARLMASIGKEGVSGPRRSQKVRSPFRGAAAAALAASLVTAAVTVALMARRQADLTARYEQVTAGLREEIGRQSEELTSLSRQVRAARDSIQFVSSPGVLTVDLQGQGERARTAARVFWDRRRDQWRLYAGDLAAPAPGRTYQLWLVTDAGVKISAGTFSAPVEAAASGTVTVPAGAGKVVAAAVTDEPEEGSSQPTTAPFLLGNV